MPNGTISQAQFDNAVTELITVDDEGEGWLVASYILGLVMGLVLGFLAARGGI